MRDDLLDAYATVEWAVAQIKPLEARIETWRGNEPYSLRIDTDSENGKKLYRLGPVKPVPAVINAESGAIINSLRSSLDLLAVALATRNGHTATKDVYFPISANRAAFIDTGPRGGKKKIKLLSDADQAVIESLKPYKGGNDLLFALHQLDITRKHRRLLGVSVFPRGIAVYHPGLAVDSQVNREWRGLEDNAPIAWTDAEAPDCKIDITLYIAFEEAGAVKGHQVAAALRQFASLANSIIKLFDAP